MLKEFIQIGLGLVRRVGGGRTTKPPEIIAYDTEVQCQDRNLLIPHPAIQITSMNQDNCGAGADRFVEYVPKRDCDESSIPALRTPRSTFAPTGGDSDDRQNSDTSQRI